MALTAALAAATSPAAASATGFATDETLSSVASSTPVVAMAPNGEAAMAWLESLGGGQSVVRASVRPPGGPWSAPQQLALDATTKSGVQIAVAADGSAALVWEDVTDSQVAVATRPAGGAFGAPELLGASTFNGSVGIDASGLATVLYSDSSGVVARDVQAGASALAASPQSVAPRCSTQTRALAVAPDGDAVADFDCSGATFALRRAGVWSVSTPIANSGTPGCPSIGASGTINAPTSVAIDSQGHAVGTVLSEQSFCVAPPFATENDSLRLVLPLGSSMTPVSDPFATASPLLFGPALVGASAAISPGGIVATWSTTSTSPFGQGMARLFAADGTPLADAQSLGTAAATGTTPVAAIAPDGRALATWVQGGGSAPSVDAAERTPGATAFGMPVSVSPATTVLQQGVAMDDAGDAAVAWLQGDAPAVVHVRGFDVTPPALSGVTIPANATAGVPASFAASSFDVWGPVMTSWSFGDGHTATGTAVTHAFTALGHFTVSVTATDAVGNAVSSTDTVQVGPPAFHAPSLSNVSLTHRRFRAGRGRTAVSARTRAQRVPVGTTFRYTVTLGLPVTNPPLLLPASLAPLVRIRIAQLASGRRSGTRCVKPTRRLARHRRCTRVLHIATLTRGVHASANAVAFSGRIGRKALVPGSYRATLTPSMGDLVGAPRTLSFVVVR